MAQNTQYLPPLNLPQPGSVQHNGGAQAIPFRDPLDAARSGLSGFVPEASYPDGYLGTIQSRREDRLLDSLKGRQNQRSYQRGVHKGERIDPGDYLWPSELQPMRRIAVQMAGVLQPDGTVAVMRDAPIGTQLEQLAINEDRLPLNPRGRVAPQKYPRELDPADKARLGPNYGITALAPPWSP